MTALTPTLSSARPVDRRLVPARPARPASRAVTEWTFVVRSVRHSLRDPEAMLMAIALPIMLMALFTGIFGGAIDPTGNYVDYVVPGIILLCAGFGASSAAVDVARDMTEGVIDRLRAMPIRADGVVTGHVAAGLARNLLATTVVLAVGLLLGFRPTASPLEWLGVVGLVVLFVLAITWLFAAVGLAARSVQAANSYGFVLLFLPYLSSAFVPTSTMPTWLQWIADNQPVTPVIETMRGLLTGTPLGTSPAWALGWCLGILLVARIWAAVLFSRRSRRG